MRIDQLSFTRFIGAIFLLAFHYGNNVFPFNGYIFSIIVKQAPSVVGYFFVLSGFVMIIAYNKKKDVLFSDFIKKRIARIYPIYMIALCLSVSLYFLFKMPLNYTELIMNIFMIQSWFPGSALSLNSPGWSLAVEFFFYLSFPILFAFYRKANYKIISITIITYWVLSQVLIYYLMSSGFDKGFPSHSHDFVYYFPIIHLNEFLVGNLAGLFYFRRIESHINRNYDWWILGVIFLLFLVFKHPLELNYFDGLLAVLFVPFILLISLNSGAITNIMQRKIFVFLGDISYGMYILQMPIHTFSIGLFSHIYIENEQVQFYLFCLTLIIISAISYKYIEMPLRNYFSNWRFSKG